MKDVCPKRQVEIALSFPDQERFCVLTDRDITLLDKIANQGGRRGHTLRLSLGSLVLRGKRVYFVERVPRQMFGGEVGQCDADAAISVNECLVH